MKNQRGTSASAAPVSVDGPTSSFTPANTADMIYFNDFP